MAAKKTLLLIGSALLVGAGVGAAGTMLLAKNSTARAPIEVTDGQFVTLGALLIPLSLGDGRFTGHARVEAQIEVGADDAEGTKARLPLIIHAINLRAYARPLGSGPDGRLPDAAAIRAIVAEEAAKVLGKGVVRSVALTSLAPA